MLLGTFNSSLWNDGGGLQKGEVDVLDISTRGWARVLPAGDPGTSGKPTFPSPRAGATALSWPQALVGSNRAQSSDVIVFGGEDESGNYLADVWVLRAYNPSANSNGALQGGVNASGAGVSIQKLSTCATAVAQPTASGSSSSASSGSSSTSAPGPSDTNSPKPPSNAAQSLFDTSVTHKALAPVSIALLLPAILAFRLSSPSALSPVTPDHRMALFYLSVLTSLVAFGVGVGGLASAFTLAAFGDPRPSHAARKLSDMSWLERRRGLNSVGDLDYALAQFPRRIDMPPTPGTAAMDIPSTRGLVGPPSLTPRMPDSLEFLIHVLLHAFLLGLCILSLVALWLRAPKGAFAAFFAWVVIFYALIIYLASRGAPQESVLSTVINRISTDHTPVPATPTPSRPLSDIGVDSVPFPTSGPYAHHQPPFRIAHESEYPTSTNGHGSAEAEEDDGLDEDTRQRAIEEEMNRRDVSIVTVPKRKLFLTNPELS
ncbi:hypothetical protein EUX98_g1480 [Antrodiella citrinella]|uniref:Uncharacterized protein n=1 Tax=Antrodiella citrinella TaxID=2447956 RepID=A0A4S4N9U4_9APHY|nr:hypothetical protein EUX98_g1480 [Antrodiella citrinella]